MPIKKEFSIAEAKNRLPAIIHNVETGMPVKLTRHGKPVAVLLSIQVYENLQNRKTGFWKTLSEFRKTMVTEPLDISDSDFENLRDHTRGRKESFLE